MKALGLLLGLLTATGAAHGDGGTVRIQHETGDLRITVFSAPEPLRVGMADLSVLVQRRAGDRAVLDAEVEIVLSGPPPAAPIEVRATRENATNELLYAAAVELPAAGPWRLRVTVEHERETVEVSGELEVAPPAPPLVALWPYLVLPPAVVALFALREWLTHRRGVHRPRSR